MRADMKKHQKIALVSMTMLGLIACQANMEAYAWWGKVKVSDGSGNGFETHSYPLGLGKGTQVQDQFGDAYGYKKGLFGLYSSNKAAIAGNGVNVSHNVITGTSVKGQTMFGDTFKSKRFLGIGPRITSVNASGMHNAVSSLVHPNNGMPSNYGTGGYPANTGSPRGQSNFAQFGPPAQSGNNFDPNALRPEMPSAP